MTRGLAAAGQYILPLICLFAAALSALRRRARKKLVVDVAQSPASDALDGMSWREFEMLVGEGFRLQGYQVVETGGGGGVRMTAPDPEESERVWDPLALAEALKQRADFLGQNTGFVYVDRERDLQQRHRETQGVPTGGKASTVPDGRVTFFMLRTKAKGALQAVWWP